MTTLAYQPRRPPADLDTEALLKEARRLRHRRWGFALAAVTVVGLAVGLPLGLGGSTRSASPRIVGSVTGPVPSVNVTAFAGQGELAFVSRGALWVLDGKTRVLREVAPRDAFEPVLSPDGRWLAYRTYLPRGVVPTLNPYPGQLWIANGNGTDPRAVHSLSEVDGLSWSPVSDKLAVVDIDPSGGQPVGIVLVDPTGSWHLVAGTGGATNFVWSPSGGDLAFSGEYADGALRTVSLSGGKPTLWQSEHNNPAYPLSYNPTVPALWLPKDEGLLFWVDQDNSASVEADGLMLYLLRRPGDRPLPLATTLLTSSIAVSASGELAITAGGNRQQEVTKVVEICAVATASCKRVPMSAGDVSFDPSWTSDGRYLVYAVGPSNDNIAMYQSLVAHWYGSLTEWELNLSNGLAQELSDSRGASYSRSSGKGSSLVSVSSDGLTFRRAPNAPAVPVASPLFPPNNWPTFYGEIDWSDQFAWASTFRAPEKTRVESASSTGQDRLTSGGFGQVSVPEARQGRATLSHQDDEIRNGPLMSRMRIAALAILITAIGFAGVASSAFGGTDSTSSPTLAQFIALARGMTEGSFAATYTLPATKGSAAGAATLYVAQRLPASGSKQQVLVLGDEGEWIYRLATSNGAIYELLKNKGSLFDCWRGARTKPFTCTGPGSLGQFGIGLDIAAQLYAPVTAEVELRTSVIAPSEKPELTTYRTGSAFGELSCLRASELNGMAFTWCLSAGGRLVTQMRPGSVGYPWTTIELEHFSDEVSAANFELSGSPRGGFSVLPTMTLPLPAPPQ